MGGFFGGGGQSLSTSEPRLGALNVQTSAFGMAIPLVYGRTRITANLIWYGDFTAIANTTTSSSGGKGGGEVESSNTTYTYRVATAMGLCEGVVTGINTVWAGKNTQTLSGVNLTLFNGTPTQAAWGYLTTAHPDEAIGYSCLAYVATSSYDLGSSASLPNHSFELDAILMTDYSGMHGAKPELVVPDYLTNPQYGVGLSVGNIGDLTYFGNYCAAANILISPAYTEQADAASHVEEICTATNSALVWSEGLIKIIPYTDSSLSSPNGAYTPDNTVRYNLNDDDYIGESGEDPVKVERKTPADAFNRVQVEFLDASNFYNTALATAQDLANIELYGLRPKEVVKLHLITDKDTAHNVAQFILQRSLYIRNVYVFTLGMRYALLEPMDLVTITDAALGLNQYPVRILEIEETPDGLFNIRAEEYLAGVSTANTYPSQTSQGYQVNYNVAPGSANAPVIFEPPTTLSIDPQIWLATSGGDDWGGCEVWVSFDDASYLQVGNINGPARHGVLSATFNNGSDPDVTNTLAVNLTVSKGNLTGGTLADRDQLLTLSYVDGEYISFEDAALTSAYNYNLTSLRRGVYGSTKASHASGTKFVRLDQALFKYNYDPSLIGETIYFKLRSFNVYGYNREDLSSLTPITYTVTGANLGTISGFALAQPWVGTSVKFKWDAFQGANSYKLEFYVSGIIKRTVDGIASTNYEYTDEDMRADGGPWRAIEARLYAVSPNGESSAAAVLSVSNPQVATPAGLSGVAGALAVTITATQPTDTDWAGMLIFGSTTSGFTPDVSGFTNLLADVPNNSHSFTGLTGGVPRYYRVAFYDQYGRGDLNLSSEISVTPLAAGGVRIVSSLPASGTEDGEVVSLTTDHKIYRWNQGTTAWVTWVDGSDILAASVTTGKLAANSVEAANISAGAVTASKISVTNLAAINADMGSITAGNITLNTSGFIRGGQTAYNTGNGFYLGYSGSTYRFSVGTSSQGVTWDGTTFTINGDLVGTGNIKLNGVTTVVSAYSASVSGFNGTVMASVTATQDTGTPFLVLASAVIRSEDTGGGGAYSAYYQLQRSVNGGAFTTLLNSPFAIDIPAVSGDNAYRYCPEMAIPLQYLETPPSGVIVYRLLKYLSGANLNTGWGPVSLTVLNTKR